MQLLNCINLSNTLWVKNHRKKINYSLKTEGTSNRLREDTAPGSSGDRVLCSNRYTVRETLLQSILGNWSVFQESWDGILEGKVDTWVILVQTQKKSFNFFFLNTTANCFDAYRQLIFYFTIRTRHVIKDSKLQKFFNMFFNISRYERGC